MEYAVEPFAWRQRLLEAGLPAQLWRDQLAEQFGHVAPLVLGQLAEFMGTGQLQRLVEAGEGGGVCLTILQ
ncbi:hypothetical protein D9M72_633020 [compost metagenome]